MTQRSQTTQATERSPKGRRAVRLGALVFIMALIAAACGGATESTATGSDSGAESESGAEAVNFTYETFDGETVEFAGFSDQPVVLNFFASWCATCIAELPDFETVSQNFAGEVQFLGLSVQDPPNLSEDLLEQTGVTFPTGLDGPGEIFLQFGGLGMPTTVFINADGTVADVHTGVLTEQSLTDAINENFS